MPDDSGVIFEHVGNLFLLDWFQYAWVVRILDFLYEFKEESAEVYFRNQYFADDFFGLFVLGVDFVIFLFGFR